MPPTAPASAPAPAASVSGGSRPRRCVLLTGARAAATLDLARSFHAAGHRVVVVDSLRAPLARFSRAADRAARLPAPRFAPAAFAEALAELCRAERVDLVVPTCEETFYVAHARPRLPARTELFCPPLPVLRRLHSKHLFQRRVARAGLPALPTRLLTRRRELVGLDLPGGVLKPEYSRFGGRVRVAPSLLEAARLPISEREPWVWQERAEGDPICTWSVVRAGRVLAHAAYRMSDQGAGGATTVFEALQHAEARRWVERFAAAEGLTGQLAFDFLDDPRRGLVALECNPRATSGAHLFRGAAPLADAFFADAPVGCAVPPDVGTDVLAIALLLYGPRWHGLSRASLTSARAWLAHLRRGQDVVGRPGDRAPALAQLPMLGELLLQAARHRRSLTDATTADIEWNGEPLPALEAVAA